MNYNVEGLLGLYSLDSKKKVVQCKSIEEWMGTQLDIGKRRVALTKVGGASISTIFLGVNCGFRGGKEPILWESMVFGGDMSGYCRRCPGTFKDAKAMHRQVVKQVKGQTQ
jgi:hypothetical protein